MKTYLPLLIGFVFFLSACSSDDPDVVTPIGEDLQTEIQVAAPEVSNISQIAAEITSEITTEDQVVIITKGIVWSTDPMPTIENDKVENGSGPGEVIAALDYLEDNTQYYIRAFAETSGEIIYSDEIQFSTLAHIVYDGWVYAFSQQDVDDFGAMGYTKVTGAIEIQGQDVTDLSSLSTIISVGGFFCWGLNVTNTSIQDFSGLDKLIEVGGPTVIQGNQNLTSLQGLNRLRVSSTGLFIGGNNLNSFEGLDSLEEVGTAEYVDECSLFSISEDGVVNFQGMNNLTTIGVPIYITGTESLQDFSGLDNVVGFTERMRIRFNNSLKNFNGLSGITTCEEFWIEGNTALENFQGLANLNVIDGVVLLSENDSLRNCQGLTALTDIEGWVVVRDNPSLLNFNGLNNLKKIRFNFSITNNSSLLSLSGLESMERIGTYNPPLPSNFDILDNTSLGDFCSLQGLFNSGSVQAEVLISGNAYNPSYSQIRDGDCSL